MPEIPEQNAGNESAPSERSQIPGIIKNYTFRIRAIGNCGVEHIRIANVAHQSTWTRIKESAVKIEEDADGVQMITFRNEDMRQFEEVLVQTQHPHSDILAQSLLIFGFSTFDAFVGLLLNRLYREVPKLIYKLEEKTVKVSELMHCKSLDEALNELIERDVSSLLRNSYDELFSTLAARQGLDTIKKFKNWPNFVEAAQRRNLITHCNGVVNSQYIDACKAAGFQPDSTIVPGSQLSVDAPYLRASLDILYEVGVKLGITLWRTAAPEMIELAEMFLNQEIYLLLERDELSLAKEMAHFAIHLPKPKSDLHRRISRVNYAQAVKWLGDDQGARAILDAVDWSGSIRDLRLGVEVLRENFDSAAELMRQIGKKGELVSEAGYRRWPIFREFRKSPQFLSAFKEVYGIDFESRALPTASEPNKLGSQLPSIGDGQMSPEPLPDNPQDDSGKKSK